VAGVVAAGRALAVAAAAGDTPREAVVVVVAAVVVGDTPREAAVAVAAIELKLETTARRSAMCPSVV
jgi:hypothetical protein